ncbi:MAG: ArsR/SmtB family transcription factor [Terriglobales bacterium]
MTSEFEPMSASAARSRVSPDDRLDAVFRALGDRTRRALLARLAKQPAMVTELAKPFDMSLPAVSKHIRVLQSAGLVRRAVDGRMHQCSLNSEPLAAVEAWLRHYRHFWQDRLESLARYAGSNRDHK